MRSSVVVVAYRPNELLRGCLESVVEQADEVILVDNGSDGDVVQTTARGIGVRVVSTGRNLGFAGGVNIGLEVASGDVLALLNDDAVAGPGWVASAAERLAAPDAGVVAPKLLLATTFAELRFPDDAWFNEPDPRPLGRRLHRVTVGGRDVLSQLVGGVHRLERGPLAGVERTWRWSSGPDAVYVPLREEAEADYIVVDGAAVRAVRLVSLVNNAGSYLSREGHAGDRGWEAPDDGQFDRPRECFAACGAAMAFTADTAARVGKFAARYFAYYEDVDFCWRVRLAGLRVYYDPRAVVRHARGATSGGQSEATVRLLSGRNRIDTLARNAPIRVLARQVRRLSNPDLPTDLRRAAHRRVALGLRDRVVLRRRWRRSPTEVWSAWAGVDEHWEDPGRSIARISLPPRVEFGD